MKKMIKLILVLLLSITLISCEGLLDIIDNDKEDVIIGDVSTYTYNFNGFNDLRSYQDKEVKDDNDINWKGVSVRNYDTYPIDDSGIILRNKDTKSSLTGSFPNGLISLSFEYRKAYTSGINDRKYSVSITNAGKTQTYKISPFGKDGLDDTIHKFKKNNLNLEGEVLVKIFATGSGQATFSNFTWTELKEEEDIIKSNTITFNSNGGTYIKPVVILEDELVLEPVKPTRPGYIFEGWFYNNLPYEFNKTLDEDITIYAKWKETDINYTSVKLFELGFGENNHTAYDNNELTFINNTGIEYTIKKERSNINTKPELDSNDKVVTLAGLSTLN